MPSPKNPSTGRGRSRNSETPPPNPLKVAHMVADSIELAPKVVIPLEVAIGARYHSDRPGAMVTVLNREDGRRYSILVLPEHSESSSLTTPTEASNETTARESGSSS